MITPTGGNTQFPNNIAQAGVQQSTANPQTSLKNAPKRIKRNKTVRPRHQAHKIQT